jgi:ribosomal protein S18 acetylase RimI-like enzyme
MDTFYKGTVGLFLPMLPITRLTPADAPMLSTLGTTTLLQSHGHSAPAEVMESYVDRAFSPESCLKELEEEGNVFHAVWYDGVPVGYTKIVYRQPHPAIAERAVTKMDRLYLLNEVFEKGLGERLLQNAIALSKAEGERGMWLNVWKGNERAIRFYGKHGFEVIGEGEFVLTETHANPNWVMLLKY